MSDTVFVTMFHPALGNVQVQAPLQAVSTYEEHGWLLLDPNATPPPVPTPYLTQAAADSRYLRDWLGGEVLTAGTPRLSPDGHLIIRTADGTTRSTYDTTEQAAWTSVGGVSSVAGRAGAVVLTAGDVSGLAPVATSGVYTDLTSRPGLGSANGVATLDGGGTVPDAQIPARLQDTALRAAYGLVVAATVTASGALVPGKHNPVDATAAGRAMTLPPGAVEGASIGVEKIDSSTNAVTVTGNIRGVPATTISLPWAHETLVLRADSAGSWWPVSGHKTKASLDAAYVSFAQFGVTAPLATGNATTDTTNLQNLIDLAPSLGPTKITLPPNQNYQINGLIPKSNVLIEGSGSILTATAAATLGVFSNRVAQVPVSNFTVRNTEFAGQGLTYGTLSERRGAIQIYNATNIRIENCIAHDFSDHGFQVLAAQNIWMTGNYLYNVCNTAAQNALDIGLLITNVVPSPQSSSSIVVTGNIVRNCLTAAVGIEASTHATEVSGTFMAHDIVIANNPHLESAVTTASGFAVIGFEVARYSNIGADAVNTTQGNKLWRAHVHHNHLYLIGAAVTGGGSPAYAIAFSDNNNSYGTQSNEYDEILDIVADHNVINSADGGILCTASSVQIDHNIIRAATQGIVLQNNSNPTSGTHQPVYQHVDQNLIWMNTAAPVVGIKVAATAWSTVTGNTITFLSTAAGTAQGIWVTGADHPKVRANTVIYAPQHGIYIFTCSNAEVCDNRIINPSTDSVGYADGIRIDTCTVTAGERTPVTGNTIQDERGTPKLRSFISVSGGAPRVIIAGTNGSNNTAVAMNLGATLVDRYGLNYISVSAITKSRNGVSYPTGLTTGVFRVGKNEILTVTYSGTPTMWKSPVNV